MRFALLITCVLVACGEDSGSAPVDATPEATIDANIDAADAQLTCEGRCAEPACAGAAECEETSASACSDGVDNDADGTIDCSDLDCRMADDDLCGAENAAQRCTDGLDNDANGLIDCADNSCRALSVCHEASDAACADRLDNDVDGSTDCEDADCAGFAACGTRVRVVAANLTSEGQNYDAGHGLRILEGLDADVVLMQELNFRDSGADAMAELSAQICGAECAIYRGGGNLIPNGVVSRFPILANGDWDDAETDTREFSWARLDVPGERELWVVSVHWLSSDAGRRENQARALSERILADVPAADYLVVGGDFNVAGGPSFTQLGRVVNTRPRPTDQDGNRNTNGPRSRVLDAVFANNAFERLEVPVHIGASAFRDGLVVDTRVYTPLEDLAPARRTDSDADGMQHMAVIRDFVVP
ncbi:MAG: endonuclease/exonuclease/phosphatase family protein [Myxococcota bacterium]